MSGLLRFGVLALAAAVVFASGFWLTRAGRPYGTAVLTVHKLVDLAAVVYLGVLVFGTARIATLSSLDWVLVAASVVAAVALFATGGVVSASDGAPSWVLALHRVAPWPLVILAGWVVYRLAGRT